MALGIGANTAVFSVVDAVLLRPLPYDAPDRIVTLDTAFLASGQTQGLVSIANFRDWRDQSSTFEAMATYRGGEFPVTPGEVAEYARVAVVDADLFRVFGVEPVVGRTFTPEETRPGRRAALVSHDYWQRRLDGDPDVLERTVRIGGDPWPIVGVLPPRFEFPRLTDLWVPERTESTSRRGHSSTATRSTSSSAPRTTRRRSPAPRGGWRPRSPPRFPSRSRPCGKRSPPRWEEPAFRALLFALFAGLALCLAVAGVYGVMADSVRRRSREIGLRIALGADRSTVLRLVLGRGLGLTLVGLLAGLAGAAAAARLLETMLFEVVPLDASVYLGVGALLGAVAAAASYLPARRAATIDPMRVLNTD